MRKVNLRYGLLEFGRELIERCETEAEKRAYNDMLVLDNMLMYERDSLFDSIKFDEELRRIYPEIEMLENMIEARRISKAKIEGSWDEQAERLIADRQGICASALLAYGTICDIGELFSGAEEWKSATENQIAIDISHVEPIRKSRKILTAPFIRLKKICGGKIYS